MFLVFIGPPGAGKGTQSKRLLEYLRIPHFSTGEMLRAAKHQDSDLGRLAAQYMDGGSLVPDDVVMGMVLERLKEPDCAGGCLFDGFPRTLQQARALDAALKARGTPLDAVIELKGDEKELISRMHKRAVAEQRVDDNPAVIAQRMDVYTRQTSPLLGYYEKQGLLHSVDAMGSPDEVFSQIKNGLDAKKNAQL
ncbi:MAG: adenylate kinase [Pirellulaceae bacterium]|nr:adenylate kinase [Pirellulaceae bacterium]